MPKDTRKILKGVQYPEGGALRTYADGQEDELEAVMSPEECERLKERGALEGDWEPKGERAAAEPRTERDRDRFAEKAMRENAQLRRELAQLRGRQAAAAESQGGQPSPPGGAGEGPEAHHLRAAPPLTPGKEEKKPPPLPEVVPAHPAQPKQTPPPPKRPPVKGID